MHNAIETFELRMVFGFLRPNRAESPTPTALPA